MAVKNLAKIYSAELEGIEAKLIEVEVDLNVGLHAFNIVGLADRALNEARERVNSALKNSGTKPPNRENRKITINLAPADFKKAGSHYDLAIALGYLLATKQISRFRTEDKLFVGELALDGRLRPINGALSIAEMARERGVAELFIPRQNASEAAAIPDIKIIPLDTLKEGIDYLEGKLKIVPFAKSDSETHAEAVVDFEEVIGQEAAKRALAIVAAGGHNLLLMGSPGVGKSMLAQALISILPELAIKEMIEITKIWSAVGLSGGKLIRIRPFRAPHQTTSPIALVGGGNEPKPGEISLAHRGILFLDELPEFTRASLEALRQPLETGWIQITRAKNMLKFPARFSLVAAMNPCPCGYYGDSQNDCVCAAYEIIKYQKRISGPLLDRIDMQIKVGRIRLRELRRSGDGSSESASIKAMVERARGAQAERFKGCGIVTNAEMKSRQVHEFVRLEPKAEIFLETLEKSRLSPRGYYRILKIARTIADLEEKEHVSGEHLAEAFSYRIREREE